MSVAHRTLHRVTRGRFGALEAGNQGPRGAALTLITRLHVALYRATFGLVGSSAGGLQTLLLTTRGRKTGRPRTVALPYFPCGEGVFVVASFAGSERDPAWYANLTANPDVTLRIKARTFRCVARVAVGEERAALWSEVLATAPFYADYQVVTTRRIPIVVFSWISDHV